MRNILTSRIGKMMAVCLIAVSSVFTFSLNEVKASDTQYTYAAVLDEVGFQLTGTVLESSRSNTVEKRLWSLSTTTTRGWLTLSEGLPAIDSQYLVSMSAMNIRPMTFPGDTGVISSSRDKTRAKYVGNLLTKSINQSVNAIKLTGTTLITTREDYFKLVFEVTRSMLAKSSGSFGDLSWTFEPATVDQLQKIGVSMSATNLKGNDLYGMTTDNYSVLKYKKHGESKVRELVVANSIPKGYEMGGPAQNITATESEKYVSELTVDHVAYMAYASYNNGYSAENIFELTGDSNVGFFTSMIIGVLTFLLNSLLFVLQLDELNEMVYGFGGRSADYYRGLAPDSWFGGANIIANVVFVVAFLALGYMIVKALLDRQKEAYNPKVRADLMDRIMKMVYIAICLALFRIAFYLVAEVNLAIVKIMYSMTLGKETNILALANSSFLGGALSSIFLTVVTFFMIFKLNVFYIVRSITICLLYAFYPLFIVAMGFGKAGEQAFSSWIRELLAAIFSQSVHAALLTFYVLVLSGQAFDPIMRIVIIMTFQPITDLFRNMVGLKSGIDGIAAGVSGSLLSTAAIATGAVAGGLIMDSKGKFSTKEAPEKKEANEEVSESSTSNSGGASEKAKEVANESKGASAKSSTNEAEFMGEVGESKTSTSTAEYTGGSKGPNVSKANGGTGGTLKPDESNGNGRNGSYNVQHPQETKGQRNLRYAKNFGKAAAGAAGITALSGAAVGIEQQGNGRTTFMRMGSAYMIKKGIDSAQIEAATREYEEVQGSLYDNQQINNMIQNDRAENPATGSGQTLSVYDNSIAHVTKHSDGSVDQLSYAKNSVENHALENYYQNNYDTDNHTHANNVLPLTDGYSISKDAHGYHLNVPPNQLQTNTQNNPNDITKPAINGIIGDRDNLDTYNKKMGALLKTYKRDKFN